MDILTGILDTPVPALLVLGGLAFIVLALVRQITAYIKVESQAERLLVALIGIVLLGCGTSMYAIGNILPSPLPTPPTATSTPVPLPTDTPVPTATPEGFAQEENFADNSNNWFVYGPDEAGNEVAVRFGGYHIRAAFQEGGGWSWGSSTAWNPVDFSLEAEATKVEGPDNNEIGVIFGGTDSNNYYRFSYSSNGFVMLGRVIDGVFEFIQYWTSSTVVTQGSATNQVELRMQDGVLTAFINDEQVLEREVSDYPGGFIGFGCGIYEEPAAYCIFDNLRIVEM